MKSTLERRRRSHLSAARRGSERLPLFYRAIRKHGEKNFLWEIVCYCDDQIALDNMEIKYVNEHQSTNVSHGYNIAEGGKGNTGTKGKTYEEIYGPEMAARLRSLRSKSLKGRLFSEEHRKNLSLANKGKKASEEAKQKMSQSRKGEKNHFFGKKHSEETKKLIGSKSVNRNWKRKTI